MNIRLNHYDSPLGIHIDHSFNSSEKETLTNKSWNQLIEHTCARNIPYYVIALRVTHDPKTDQMIYKPFDAIQFFSPFNIKEKEKVFEISQDIYCFAMECFDFQNGLELKKTKNYNFKIFRMNNSQPNQYISYIWQALNYNNSSEKIAQSQYIVSTAYFFGETLGCEKNIEESKKWLRCSAANGLTQAESLIGHRYFYGSDGFPENKELAYEFFLKASDKGDLESTKMINKHDLSNS